MTKIERQIEPRLRHEETIPWAAKIRHLQIDLTGVDALLREKQ